MPPALEPLTALSTTNRWSVAFEVACNFVSVKSPGSVRDARHALNPRRRPQTANDAVPPHFSSHEL